MLKIKKIIIFLSAVFLVLVGYKKNSDFNNQKKNTEELIEKQEIKGQENSIDEKDSGTKKETDKKERATSSK